MNTPTDPSASDRIPGDDSPDSASLRRALSLMWLAESGPMEAAPADSLAGIRGTLGLEKTTPRPRFRLGWPLAAAGWAAAVIAFHVAREPHEPGATPSDAPLHVALSPVPTKLAMVSLSPLENTAALRREIADLQERLRENDTTAESNRHGVHRPVILELAPPGTAPRADSRERILDLIATALEHDLNRRAAPATGEVVIERGWAEWATSGLPRDTVFRHRAFPRDHAADLGLLPGPGGQFLDPATGWLWAPDFETTDYLGRAAPPELDRTAFAAIPSPAPNLDPETRSLPVPQTPSGYLVGTSDGQNIVALSNLPALTDGQTLELVTVNSVGPSANFSIPTGTNSSTDGWSFSGLIPNSIGSIGNLSVRSFDANGHPTVIIQSSP